MTLNIDTATAVCDQNTGRFEQEDQDLICHSDTGKVTKGPAGRKDTFFHSADIKSQPQYNHWTGEVMKYTPARGRSFAAQK